VDQGVQDGNIERNMECLDRSSGHSRFDICFHGIGYGLAGFSVVLG